MNTQPLSHRLDRRHNVASLAISLARPGASGAEGVDGQVKLIKP